MTVSTSKNSIYRMLNYVTILFITERVNLSNQIQLRECASYSYCAHSWCQQTNLLRKKFLRDFLLWDFTIKQLVKTSLAIWAKHGKLSASWWGRNVFLKQNYQCAEA